MEKIENPNGARGRLSKEGANPFIMDRLRSE